MGRGSPGSCACTACAEYSSNCSLAEGNFTSMVLTVNPPRKTHFSRGCQATPIRGWKLLLSREFKDPEGWMIAPFPPATRLSFPLGSKLLCSPYFVVSGLSLL